MHRLPAVCRSDATRLGYALRTVGGTLALALALAAPALADNPGKPDSPGNSASAPGQLKQQAPPATPAQPSPGKSAAAPGHQKQSGKPAKPAKPAQPKKAKKSGKPAQAAQPPATTAKTAHQKVTLCHSTGSAKNPYVEITVSVNAVAAHRRHHDGRDIIPAPAGGCPGGPAAPSQQQPEKTKPAKSQEKVTICHATGSEKNPFVKITIAMSGWQNGHSKHSGDILLASADASCPGATAASGQPTSSPTQGAPAASGSVSGNAVSLGATPAGPNVTATGVKGASATRHAGPPASAQGKSKPRGGVRGATSSLGRALRSTATRTLPFTGLPVWLPMAAALALLAGGLLLRRQARAR
jgi:hypothetical protein